MQRKNERLRKCYIQRELVTLERRVRNERKKKDIQRLNKC